MSYLEVFGVLIGAGVDVSKFFGVGAKFFGVGAGVLKRGAEAESKSEKCDSAHLCFTPSADSASLLVEIKKNFFALVLGFSGCDVTIRACFGIFGRV